MSQNPYPPGLSTDSKVQYPSDSNLPPFDISHSKPFQYGNTSMNSTHTDDPSWSPGQCCNLSKYEGRFRVKYHTKSQGDPNITRAAKNRKVVAKKKQLAFYRRRKIQQEKELNRFKDIKKSVSIHGKKTFPESLEPLSSQLLSPLSSGLKGGAPAKKAKLDDCMIINELQLTNRGSDCFVNSIIQLLRNTPYIQFIKVHLPSILSNSTLDSYRLSKLLTNIYEEKSFGRSKSVAAIRTYVAQMSDKGYLDNGTQQDAEEFLRALDNVFHVELIESETFKDTRDLHWGREEIKRKFVDNGSSGACQICGNYPILSEDPFLFFKTEKYTNSNRNHTFFSCTGKFF